jgi:hypothetical protein
LIFLYDLIGIKGSLFQFFEKIIGIIMIERHFTGSSLAQYQCVTQNSDHPFYGI